MVTIASLDNNTGAVTDTAGVRYSLMGADDGRTVRFESTKTVPGTTNRRTEVLYSMNPAAAIDATPLGRLTAAGHDAATAAAAHDMNLQDAFQIADAYALAPVDQAEAPRHGMLAGLTPLEDTAAHVLRWSRISDEHRRSRSWWVRRLRKMQQQ